MVKSFTYISILILFCTACSTILKSPKYELANGKYKLKEKNKNYVCYVQNKNDTVSIYKFPEKTKTVLTSEIVEFSPVVHKIVQPSLDVDILTALFKIRPNANVVPSQLNANFNGNIYFGLRKDIYKIYYQKDPLGAYQRQIDHFGFSGGVFAGLSNTAVNASTTNAQSKADYDGIVFQKGLAGIVGVNKLTIGISVGFDNLMDSNKSVWIYQNKPWFGLMLGLNLN